MLYQCIYRKHYGYVCINKTRSKDNYCNKHNNKKNYIFEIINMAIGNKNISYEEDLYEIFKVLYDEEIIININKSYKNTNTENNRFDIFLTIVKYILPRSKLLEILYKVIVLNGKLKLTQKNIIIFLYNIFKNTLELSQDSDNIIKIQKIQRFTRNYLYRKITKYNNEKSENLEDPFTSDNIDEILITHKFSYKDSKGHIYIFNAIELEYFINNIGAWNPYTREEFSQETLNNLKLFLKYNNCELKKDDIIWKTSTHALTDLSQHLEKMGFYNDIKWLEKITFEICKKIISVYKNMSNAGFENLYFDNNFELREETYIYDFCKESIRLFKDGNNHYLLCCNFVKALALNLEDFYNNLPSWLSSLETPLPFLNRSPNENNGMLFMYIQNLIDNINVIENEIRDDYRNDEEDFHWQISQIEFNFL